MGYSKKMMGKEVGDAATYAAPHNMQGKAEPIQSNPGKRAPKRDNNSDWTPMDGVAIGSNNGVKTSGIKIRGTGAATKGVMARGPMA